MADFVSAIQNTELWEGGFSNEPSDSGGMTYRGISRNNWPGWIGWQIIDPIVAQTPASHLDSLLAQETNLQCAVVSFYRRNFWHYDGINDQAVANKIFDLAVNVGEHHAIKIVQQVLDINADGIYGPFTEQEINLHLGNGSLLSAIRQQAEKYHEEIVQSHPEDAKFLAGWLRRDAA